MDQLLHVAKALYDNMCLANPHVKEPFDRAHEDVQRFYIEQARSAIFAIKQTALPA